MIIKIDSILVISIIILSASVYLCTLSIIGWVAIYKNRTIEELNNYKKKINALSWYKKLFIISPGSTSRELFEFGILRLSGISIILLFTGIIILSKFR